MMRYWISVSLAAVVFEGLVEKKKVEVVSLMELPHV